MMSSSRDRTRWADELSQAAVANYLASSGLRNGWPAGPVKVLKGDQRGSADGRVIAIVGAGASNAAAGLPTSRDAANLLQARLRPDDALLREELERLSTQYRLDADEFETRLLALSKFYPHRLLGHLHDLYGRRYYASVCYEILAHMLKHRFLEAIVNFNFDELLDQAVDDEVGPGNYYRVVSDGDCPEDLERLAARHERLRMPLYVKPHGTASHKSTMRFTREAYFMLPEDLHHLLETLLSTGPVTLLVIGYGLQSVEFRTLLRKHAQRIESLYLLNSSRILDIGDDVIRKKVRYVPVQSEGGLDSALLALWRAVENRFTRHFRPRDIDRHVLIGTLFREQADIDHRESDRAEALVDYLGDRTYVELALAIAKSKGFVNVGQLAAGRAGKYFTHYKSSAAITGTKSKSLAEMCRELGLKQRGYSVEGVRWGKAGSGSDKGDSRLIVTEEQFASSVRPQLIRAVGRQLSESRKQAWRERACLVERVMQDMYSGDEVELQPAEGARHLHMFSEPRTLMTLLAMKAYSLELLAGELSALYCVAETGAWLLGRDVARSLRPRRQLRIALIVADTTCVEDLKKEYRSRDLLIAEVPWWLHNRHLTIATDGGQPRGAIFFERRLREQSISAVAVDRAEDCATVMDVFCAYWIKARRYERARKEMLVNAVQRETVRTWFSQWSQGNGGKEPRV